MKLKVLLTTVTICLSMNTQAEDKRHRYHRYETQLITPTLWVQEPDLFACNLTNVSKKTRTVQVRIITNGDVLLNSGEISVDPLYTANYYIEGLEGRGGPIYCEFTVEGPKKWYRGAAKLFADNVRPVTDFVAIAAE